MKTRMDRLWRCSQLVAPTVGDFIPCWDFDAATRKICRLHKSNTCSMICKCEGPIESIPREVAE